MIKISILIMLDALSIINLSLYDYKINAQWFLLTNTNKI